LSGDEQTDLRRAEMLKFAAVQACRIYRANGGRGRPIITFRRVGQNIEARWSAIKSTASMFDDVREAEAWRQA